MKTAKSGAKKPGKISGKIILRVIMFKIYLFDPLYNNVLIHYWCGFYHYIVRRNAPSFEIVATDIFHKIIDTEG